jgi:3-isopropylmalate/(R)-2-methylmalate dehydratase large subunit
VPPTLRFVIDGEMPNYLLAKDLILNVGDGFLSHVLPFESNVVNRKYIIHCNYYFLLVVFHVQTLITNIQIIGEISMSGATYKTMEFVGTTVESLTVCIQRFFFFYMRMLFPQV